MSVTRAAEPAVIHNLERVRSTHEFAVTGAPDTRTPRKGSITVRPERLKLIYYDGELRWVGVWGRTIRRDGSISTYREVGFSGFRGSDDLLPHWVDSILDAEGVQWPGGAEPALRTPSATASRRGR